VKPIVVRYGLISGAVLAVLTAIHLPLVMQGRLDLSVAAYVGFTSMFLAFLAVFFGIRAYRDTTGGGAITFGRAFKVGILIALVTCAVYVVAWQIVFWGFIPDFGDKYAALTLADLRAKGAPPEEIAKMEQQMASFKVWYKNPFLNVAVTFVEVFPPGLIVTLISAAILRKKRDAAAPVTA
jgi:hypothetical protein